MAGPRLHVMAWRNLWRNRRRTLITIGSIVFGVLLAILFAGLSDSTLRDTLDAAARLGAGHVTIQHPGYLDAPSTGRTVTGTSRLQEAARAVPGVRTTVARVTGQVMLSTAAESRGAQFIAYDPRAETKDTLSLLDAIPEADRLAGPDGQGIILGADLAESLGAVRGRKVVYTLTDKRGEIVTGLARVSGILHTGIDSMDANLCLLPIDAVRGVLGYGPEEATFVALFLDDNRVADRIAAAVRARMPADVATLTWHELQPDLAYYISAKWSGLAVMGVIMLLLTAAGIFNTLFVSVLERLREFGILLAIGFSPPRLFTLVLWESLWLGLVGIASGVAVTAAPYWYLATRGINMASMSGGKAVEVAGVGVNPQMYVRITPEELVTVLAAILISTLLAGLYPAWRTSRVVPVEAIKLV